MANVLKKERQMQALELLTNGCSIRATERVTGIHRDTICRLVVRFGDACRVFLDRQMNDLELTHVEVDEIWTFVGKKQARLTTDERAERSDIGDVYLWIGVDHPTRLVPSFILGKRSADMARRFMLDLAGRLVAPQNPHQSDDHAYNRPGYRPIVQISTDGFPAYPEAVDLAFGPYAKFGTIIKDYRNAQIIYTPSEMVGAKRRGVFGIGDHEERTICTSHVERHNLTTRTFMKRFNRLTLGFSKKLENLAAATAMYIAFYNYCWRPRKPGKTGKRFPTPCMMAGITEKPWSFAELFERVTV
jgi:IS1 family transposase